MPYGHSKGRKTKLCTRSQSNCRTYQDTPGRWNVVPFQKGVGIPTETGVVETDNSSNNYRGIKCAALVLVLRSTKCSGCRSMIAVLRSSGQGMR